MIEFESIVIATEELQAASDKVLDMFSPDLAGNKVVVRNDLYWKVNGNVVLANKSYNQLDCNKGTTLFIEKEYTYGHATLFKFALNDLYIVLLRNNKVID